MMGVHYTMQSRFVDSNRREDFTMVLRNSCKNEVIYT